MALDDVYTEVLGEHSRNPDHKHKLSCATCQVKGKNPSCGDEITIELQVEGGIVKEAAFTGVGCAISQASTDIMAELIRGKSVEDARRLVDDIQIRPFNSTRKVYIIPDAHLMNTEARNFFGRILVLYSKGAKDRFD